MIFWFLILILYSLYLNFKHHFKWFLIINSLFVIISTIMMMVFPEFLKWIILINLLLEFFISIYFYNINLLVSIIHLALIMSLFYYELYWLMLLCLILIIIEWELVFSVYNQYNINFQDKLLQNQVLEIENIYRNMREWRHDYHNHLQSLKFKLKQNQIQDSINYLDQLETELDSIGQIVETGNLNIDAILNSKLSLAQKKNIDINVKAIVPQKLLINDIDCCALLGNLVDNAIEACREVSGNKFIRLYLGLYKQQFYISISNSTNELVKKLDFEYISHKRGDHGHGLLRINKIVNKYQGYINRQNEPGVFVTEIMLPLC